MIYEENLDRLHTVLNSYAPNGLIRLKIACIRHEMEEAGEPCSRIATRFAGILADGLAFDNWEGAQ